VGQADVAEEDRRGLLCSTEANVAAQPCSFGGSSSNAYVPDDLGIRLWAKRSEESVQWSTGCWGELPVCKAEEGAGDCGEGEGEGGEEESEEGEEGREAGKGYSLGSRVEVEVAGKVKPDTAASAATGSSHPNISNQTFHAGGQGKSWATP
jgi:hypothetical protein